MRSGSLGTCGSLPADPSAQHLVLRVRDTIAGAAGVALFLLSSACAMAESVKVALPLKGPADSRQDAVKAELAEIVGVAEATLAEGALAVTLKEGKQVGLAQIAENGFGIVDIRWGAPATEEGK